MKFEAILIINKRQWNRIARVDVCPHNVLTLKAEQPFNDLQIIPDFASCFYFSENANDSWNEIWSGDESPEEINKALFF